MSDLWWRVDTGIDDETLGPDGKPLQHGRCDGCGNPSHWTDVEVPADAWTTFLEEESELDRESPGEISMSAIIDTLMRHIAAQRLV